MKLLNFENQAIVEIKKQCAKHNLSPSALAFHINTLPVRIYEIISGRRRLTVDTDLRLTKFFKLKKRYFLDMQIDYDIKLKQLEIEKELDNIKTVDEVITPRF